ncbi:MAG TPA: DEAD/DEAH box helicase [Ornithinimicrobium sp.]|uniref:DEAD/DEAH box helicase n=1 Tax=Ornithinimicrobium sp. TaxID=1977084 RepID=UPI002B475532|nr:DEAD/DEAH box helicase [Ornithinimicrobium sp.]HKJ12376.1 DEAD/DEAH box helicase [Ornithinimicrobium sp.]
MAARTQFDPASALAHLARGERSASLLHTHTVPAREARHASYPAWIDPGVHAALAGSGIETLWSHQRELADALWDGVHAVVSTAAASGKSLGYLLPVLTKLAQGSSSPTGRGATALYLAPTKALAADQEARIRALAVPGVAVAAYDGDTAAEERRWIRQHAHYVLTNPDLLHHSLLPGHEHWASFLRRLSFVVVDECHVYRGVFGTHVSAVLRRLLRIAARYNAHPTVALASATVADPGDHARALTGFPVREVTRDGSPRESVTFALWEPPMTSDGTRRSAVTEGADLFTELVARDVQTVAFARSRVGVEVVADIARRRLADISPDGAGSVAAYRGGYLPEDRRALETGLRERHIVGLAATTALELGVDIAGLDAVVLAGWPGRLSSMWQQAGRAGRAGQPSLAVLVAADDPLDTYVVHHPARIFSSPVESTVVDPENPYVLAPHLAAAAAELPLTLEDRRWFGPTVPALARRLTEQQILRRRPAGWFWARPERASDQLTLRGVGASVRIVDATTGRVLGTVDHARAHSTVHTGAVYLHQGEPHVVTALDLDAGTATVVAGDPGWSTQAASVSEFRVTSPEAVISMPWGPATVCFGQVEVSSRVTAFLRRLPSGEVIGRHPLDLPERTLRTRAVWWTMPDAQIAAAGVETTDVPGALHAAEHASIGLLPLVATCDRWDIGGVSTALHPDTGQPTVMVYDGHPGGAGFARCGYDRAAVWLDATRRAIEQCSCPRGCPSCVQSPKCGNGNEPLHKAGAVAVLRHLLAALG